MIDTGRRALLAIEALEEELEASGKPEDARAKATLAHLLKIARGPEPNWWASPPIG